ISRKISSLRSPYFLDFQFQPQGIKVEGIFYPIVKMAWAKGETLGEFLEVNRRSAQAIAKLSASIESLAAYLEKEKIAHGDFQTGNLMVSDGGATVQLIDYD
ncbi:serine/threonine protein kinase, partial [Klebsiella pneumoniae]|nr:serine/threonine protein kinase [Klebsiella pneumoniae]